MNKNPTNGKIKTYGGLFLGGVAILVAGIILSAYKDSLHVYRFVTQYDSRHIPIANYVSNGEVRVSAGTVSFRDCATGEYETLSGSFSVGNADATIYNDPKPCKGY